jgi:hypothetical protein
VDRGRHGCYRYHPLGFSLVAPRTQDLHGRQGGAEELLELAHGGSRSSMRSRPRLLLEPILVGHVEQPEVHRIGDARGRRVDVRFKSASNADLCGMVDTIRFRAECLDRLTCLMVEVPALSQCKGATCPWPADSRSSISCSLNGSSSRKSRWRPGCHCSRIPGPGISANYVRYAPKAR